MQKCVADVRAWIISNRLIIIDKKIEIFINGSKWKLSKVRLECLTFGYLSVRPVSEVWNLGVWSDGHMSMDTTSKKLAQSPLKAYA